MDYDTELWGAIKFNNPNEALYLVGEHIKNGSIQLLEQTWLYATSYFGSFIHFNYYKWLSFCKDLLTILEKKELHISEAFDITIKLCFLYKYTQVYSIPPKVNILVLRKKILGFFNDELKLSSKGILQFQSFLPKEEQEREFCIKIISGLISLWNEKKYVEFRNCLEYIDRKKYEIELPSNLCLKWGQVHYSMNIFIWECLCILEPSFNTLKNLYINLYIFI